MLCLVAALVLLAPSRDIRVDQDWDFHRIETATDAASEPYRGRDWEEVNLPHSAKLIDERNLIATSFQGTVWYRKSFRAGPGYRSKRVVLKFEGAMQVADIWVNGMLRVHHEGGYLPFQVDLSDELGVGKDAQVLVRLDNRDHANFNPGRPQSQLDFTYAGGLYRNVWLEVTEPEHIENVYAAPIRVSERSATVQVQVATALVQPGSRVRIELLDPSAKVVASRDETAAAVITKEFQIGNPKLWDLEHPQLYRVVTRIVLDGREVDRLATRFGVRDLEFDSKKGFSINGKPAKLEGSNRHMAFPVVGNAASDNAQYREAKLLKSLGLNILRLAHYPQSPAFLDACDELGILVIDPIPGWQFYRGTPEFRDHVLSDVKETVIRDRNHPCVAIFETCLNETYGAPDEFWRECSQIAHESFSPGNFFTGGDSYGKHDYSRPLWDVPWTGWDDDTFTRPALFKMQMGVDREYGDYEFGGEQSTSRADRADGEGALLLQAWNYIWSHNRNRGNSWSYGDLTWEAIDTRRGMSEASPISKSGLLDLFRYPKPVADFYKSQGLRAPYIHIANEWTTRPSPTKVVVFANCDEVALFLNGKEVGRQRPDSGPTTAYLGPKVADPLYWAHGKGEIVPAAQLESPVGGLVGALPFSGGNCRNLSHPPFTFDGIRYVPGKLEAVGYLKGKLVAKTQILTPGKPDHVVIEVADGGRPLEADGSDFVFVYATVCDRNGEVVTGYHSNLKLTVTGVAEALPGKERPPIGGVAPFMIRAKTTAGSVHLTVEGEGVKAGQINLKTKPWDG